MELWNKFWVDFMNIPLEKFQGWFQMDIIGTWKEWAFKIGLIIGALEQRMLILLDIEKLMAAPDMGLTDSPLH